MEVARLMFTLAEKEFVMGYRKRITRRIFARKPIIYHDFILLCLGLVTFCRWIMIAWLHYLCIFLESTLDALLMICGDLPYEYFGIIEFLGCFRRYLRTWMLEGEEEKISIASNSFSSWVFMLGWFL